MKASPPLPPLTVLLYFRHRLRRASNRCTAAIIEGSTCSSQWQLDRDQRCRLREVTRDQKKTRSQPVVTAVNEQFGLSLSLSSLMSGGCLQLTTLALPAGAPDQLLPHPLLIESYDLRSLVREGNGEVFRGQAEEAGRGRMSLSKRKGQEGGPPDPPANLNSLLERRRSRDSNVADRPTQKRFCPGPPSCCRGRAR